MEKITKIKDLQIKIWKLKIYFLNFFSIFVDFCFNGILIFQSFDQSTTFIKFY